jgi:hypothetical protein
LGVAAVSTDEALQGYAFNGGPHSLTANELVEQVKPMLLGARAAQLDCIRQRINATV